MRKLAKITDGLIGQPMFQLLKKAKKMEKAGQKISHFEIGDSDFRAHQHIIDATKNALDKDHTHYVDSAGILKFKRAIADHIEETLLFRPNLEQIVVMPANSIIDFVLRCVADPGDEVIYQDPGFSTYIAVTNYTGIKKVGVPLRQEEAFHLNPNEVAKRITDKTRLLIVNSPHNPTGAVLGKKTVESIYTIAQENDLYILSDEIYSLVIHEGKHNSFGVFDQCRERTIILNGFAKNYSMPGWRLGYAIAPKKLIEKMTLLFQTIYSCTPPFIQYAGIAALKGDQKPIDERIQCYKKLRDLIVGKLNEIPGISCLKPEGACYVFPSIKDTGMTSAEFADFALEKAGVALLPGTCFGEYGEGYVRLCYTREPEIIERGCENLKKALENRKIKIVETIKIVPEKTRAQSIEV
jgi:aspartate/methionine/tyrosine aminotransferase